jgi:hypothetical protein
MVSKFKMAEPLMLKEERGARSESRGPKWESRGGGRSRPERGERSARPAWGQRSERSARPERGEKSERSARPESGERPKRIFKKNGNPFYKKKAAKAARPHAN